MARRWRLPLLRGARCGRTMCVRIVITDGASQSALPFQQVHHRGTQGRAVDRHKSTTVFYLRKIGGQSCKMPPTRQQTESARQRARRGHPPSIRGHGHSVPMPWGRIAASPLPHGAVRRANACGRSSWHNSGSEHATRRAAPSAWIRYTRSPQYERYFIQPGAGVNREPQDHGIVVVRPTARRAASSLARVAR